MRYKTRRKRSWLFGGLLLLGSFVTARLIGRLLSVSEEEENLDDNAPRKLRFQLNERRYPPFYDHDIQGLRVEGEFDESGSRQLAVMGISQAELEDTMGQAGKRLAVACGDGAGLWHPAVAENTLAYARAADRKGDVYALAAYVGPSVLMLLPGSLTSDGHFTAFKSTRLLALTNSDGLLYDYPNVPIIDFGGR